MKTLAGVMAVTGLRIGEVLQLKITDLDLDRGVPGRARARTTCDTPSRPDP